MIILCRIMQTGLKSGCLQRMGGMSAWGTAGMPIHCAIMLFIVAYNRIVNQYIKIQTSLSLPQNIKTTKNISTEHHNFKFDHKCSIVLLFFAHFQFPFSNTIQRPFQHHPPPNYASYKPSKLIDHFGPCWMRSSLQGANNTMDSYVLTEEIIEYYIKLSKARLIMENLQNGLIHAQSYIVNGGISLHSIQLRPFQNLIYANIFHALHFKFQILTSEVENLKSELVSVKQQMQDVKQMINRPSRTPTFVLLKEKSGRMRKEFTKHLACPFKHCRSKYSSRIALRAHIRRRHPEEAPRNHSS